MKVIIAKIVVVVFIVVCLVSFMFSPAALKALMVSAGIFVIVFTIAWAIDTIVVDRN